MTFLLGVFGVMTLYAVFCPNCVVDEDSADDDAVPETHAP